MRLYIPLLTGLLAVGCTGKGAGYGLTFDTATEAMPSGTVDTDGDGHFADDANPDLVDCDDGNAKVNPDAPEICDGLDNDCNGRIDGEEMASGDPADAEWYEDADGDGYAYSVPGSPSLEPITERWYDETLGCPLGATLAYGDCDDGDPTVYTGAPELCDGVDNDCDEKTDDEDPNAEAPVWYRDRDEDTFGVSKQKVKSCLQPDGYAAQDGDCDDGDASAFPHTCEVWSTHADECVAAEVCDAAEVAECLSPGECALRSGSIYYAR